MLIMMFLGAYFDDFKFRTFIIIYNNSIIILGSTVVGFHFITLNILK